MVSGVGGGIFLRCRSCLIPPVFDRPSSFFSVGGEDGWWWISSLGVPIPWPTRAKPQTHFSSPALWSPACYHPLTSSPVATASLGSDPSSSDVDSDGLFAASRSFKRKVFDWVCWFSRDLPIVGALGISPELVPVVYCSSFDILSVFWAAGVGSGWSISLLFVSAGLLYGFSRWCHVIVTVKCLRSSVEIGSSAMPKGIVDFGVSLVPKGVTCAGPSGIIILLTLVSDLSSRGFNLCSALRLDVLIVLLYVIIVSVIVFRTLITYHMFSVDLF